MGSMVLGTVFSASLSSPLSLPLSVCLLSVCLSAPPPPSLSLSLSPSTPLSSVYLPVYFFLSLSAFSYNIVSFKIESFLTFYEVLYQEGPVKAARRPEFVIKSQHMMSDLLKIATTKNKINK